jgi:membrane associated rhomboid family serine protease
VVTAVLVLANVVAYLLEIRHGGSFFGGPTDSVAVRYGAIPYELTHPADHCALITHRLAAGVYGEAVACQGAASGALGALTGRAPSQPPTALTVITSMFLHGSFLHIFGNMVFLGVFGPTVEDRLGRVRFPAFYLAGGLVALAAQVLADPSSTTPTLGASGAIAAVLGGYVLMAPRARIITLVFIVFFFTIVEVPAVLLLGFWFLEQLYLGTAGLTGPVGGGEGVAYFAHVGGFAFGLLTIGLFAGRTRARRHLPVY